MSPQSDDREALRRLSGAGPAALLVLIALWEIASVLGLGRGMPGAADWEAAAEWVRAERMEGELIVFAPGWIDPVGRQHLGDQMTVDMAARMDAARYPVIWELSARGARAPETRGLKADRSRSFGELQVRRYRQRAAELVFDFTSRWRQAEVSGDIARPPVLSLEEVGFEPHRCVKVVPRPGGTVTLRWPEAQLGSEIVGYVGLADIFTRRDVRDPGRLVLEVDGAEVARARAGIEDGWVRFAARTEPGDARVDLKLEAVGPDATDRRICFAMEARR